MKQNNPLVSVIVTSYNNAKYIENCLDALRKQTLENIEIICVDDASTDNSREILERYEKKDKRIKVIYRAENGGVSQARNIGIKKSTAPYIMLCDGDDYYATEACEKMYKAITDNKVDLALCEVNVIYHASQYMKSSDNEYYRLKYAGKQLLSNAKIFNTDLSPTDKIFRKEILKKYEITFPEGLRFEDAYFCVAYMSISKTAYYLKKKLYNYVRHDDSLMSQTWSNDAKEDNAIDHLYIAFRLYNFLEQNDLIDGNETFFWRYFEAFEAFAIRNSKTRKRIKLVRDEAKKFIEDHQKSFDKAAISTRNNIERLNAGATSSFLTVARIKRLLMGLMPSYRAAVDNIHALRFIIDMQTEAMKLLERPYDERETK